MHALASTATPHRPQCGSTSKAKYGGYSGGIVVQVKTARSNFKGKQPIHTVWRRRSQKSCFVTGFGSTGHEIVKVFFCSQLVSSSLISGGLSFLVMATGQALVARGVSGSTYQFNGIIGYLVLE